MKFLRRIQSSKEKKLAALFLAKTWSFPEEGDAAKVEGAAALSIFLHKSV